MSRVKFEVKDGKLHIDGKAVKKVWESSNGWFIFGIEKENDEWLGVMRARCIGGIISDWGHFSEQGIKDLEEKGIIWEISEGDLFFAVFG
jgi:hypothetical protein